MNGLNGLVKVGVAGLLVYGVYAGVNAGDVVSTLGGAAQQAQGIVEQVDLQGERDSTVLELPDEGEEYWTAESGYDEGEAEVFARIGDEPELPVDAPSAIQNTPTQTGVVDDSDCVCEDADGESDEDCDDAEVDENEAREQDQPDCDDEAEG